MNLPGSGTVSFVDLNDVAYLDPWTAATLQSLGRSGVLLYDPGTPTSAAVKQAASCYWRWRDAGGAVMTEATARAEAIRLELLREGELSSFETGTPAAGAEQWLAGVLAERIPARSSLRRYRKATTWATLPAWAGAMLLVVASLLLLLSGFGYASAIAMCFAVIVGCLAYSWRLRRVKAWWAGAADSQESAEEAASWWGSRGSKGPRAS